MRRFPSLGESLDALVDLARLAPQSVEIIRARRERVLLHPSPGEKSGSRFGQLGQQQLILSIFYLSSLSLQRSFLRLVSFQVQKVPRSAAIKSRPQTARRIQISRNAANLERARARAHSARTSDRSGFATRRRASRFEVR